MQCLNPTIYKQFLNRTMEIYGKYITFAFHPRSLEGSAPPTKGEQERFGFNDISSALAGTIEAIQNALQPQSKPLTHRNMVELIEQAVNKGNIQLKEEIQGNLVILKDSIVTEANEHAEKFTTNLAKKMEHLEK